jgi:hypothetical protein
MLKFIHDEKYHKKLSSQQTDAIAYGYFGDDILDISP